MKPPFIPRPSDTGDTTYFERRNERADVRRQLKSHGSMDLLAAVASGEVVPEDGPASRSGSPLPTGGMSPFRTGSPAPGSHGGGLLSPVASGSPRGSATGSGLLAGSRSRSGSTQSRQSVISIGGAAGGPGGQTISRFCSQSPALCRVSPVPAGRPVPGYCQCACPCACTCSCSCLRLDSPGHAHSKPKIVLPCSFEAPPRPASRLFFRRAPADPPAVAVASTCSRSAHCSSRPALCQAGPGTGGCACAEVLAAALAGAGLVASGCQALAEGVGSPSGPLVGSRVHSPVVAAGVASSPASLLSGGGGSGGSPFVLVSDGGPVSPPTMAHALRPSPSVGSLLSAVGGGACSSSSSPAGGPPRETVARHQRNLSDTGGVFKDGRRRSSGVHSEANSAQEDFMKLFTSASQGEDRLEVFSFVSRGSQR
ncbi:hypothetical protein H696_00957 [Fonticula alba]|uniref:Uncharacterized protein n=1 Tax=Fonticula alba TaxID=691883 RepID=A0A058ZG93_FONAL|nr:hypothetical protein H696_00957 [Fonticula alba]KCV73420.1 hypothetical protein H696_00957 [Fonticula alba]|eukprot:XP_009493121.1 hypothetical protein H696_00957 [Fonticula alba]